MSRMRFIKEMNLVGGGRCYSISWNSNAVFNSKIVVVMLVHNNCDHIIRSVKSVLGQVTSSSFALLIVDDSSTDDWEVRLNHRLLDERIVVAKTVCGKAWRARNLAHRLVWSEFPNYEWICRIDADDLMASDNVLENTILSIQKTKSDAMWVLSGNLLEENGRQLNRENRPTRSLLEDDDLLQRLDGMKNGIGEAELPSCNLWIKRGFTCHYPEVDSAEDHWLLAHLLARYKEEGCILTDIIHSVYNLSGTLTMSNRRRGQFLRSRDILYRSTRYWLGRETNLNDVICLGWGGEGAVWLEKGTVKKRFFDTNLTDNQAEWLSMRSSRKHLPKAKWNKVDGRWEAEYSYSETEPATDVSLAAISRFISFCLDEGIVCLNITQRNFRTDDGELLLIDLGRDILPFETRFFRDMCARLYLVFVQGVSDIELGLMTMSFRNNVTQLRSIEGFEQFFHREMHHWFLSHGYLAKPFRDIKQQKRHHSDITLMIKTCPMDSSVLERSVYHIVGQLCERDSFREVILLIDPHEGPYLRQYTEGDLAILMETANKLERSGIIDRFLVAPLFQNNSLISDLYQRWFGKKSEATHTIEGAPLFPQLWGFEQLATRYVLQMDVDVIIGRNSEEHDVIGEMREAIKGEDIFSVGFNIPQSAGARPKPYNAPKGCFVPEVRLGLLDLKRIMKQRPYPNTVVDGKLTTHWHRSIEKYQKETEWRSLRGGDPRSYFIHPLNDYKQDLRFIDRVIDQVEQNFVPSVQRLKWDLCGDTNDWQYKKRKEPIVVLIFGKEPGSHWARGCIKSLFAQKDVDWGAIVIDDCSSPEHQTWLYSYIGPFRDRITLVRFRNHDATADDIQQIIQDVCTDPDQIIVLMRSNECFMHSCVLAHMVNKLLEKHRTIWGHTYMSEHPLGLSIDTRNKECESDFDDYQLPFELRGMRLKDINGALVHSVLKRTSDPKLLEYDTTCGLFIQDYLFYNSHIQYNRTNERPLRSTSFIPNMRRIEIDITYDCNLRCAGCCRSCSQAPSKLNMPIEMIHAFLKETERMNIQWESVHILGGEPTLHPQFNEIITILNDWFERYSPSTDLKVISNGTGRKVIDELAKIPKRWLYDRSFKLGVVTNYFEPFNLAPIDLPEWRYEDFTKGCYITQDSGIGLTPFGYFHCALAGGIERIMKFEMGFKSIPRHPWDFLDQMRCYCRYCGHFLNDTYQSRSDQLATGISPNTMSETWKKAYENWVKRSDALK